MNLRIVVLGIVVACCGLAETGDGQIFPRLRRNLGGRLLQQQQTFPQRNQLPPIQTQPRFDSNTYRYTQPKAPVTYVPGTRQQQQLVQARQDPRQAASAESEFTASRLADGRVILVPRQQQAPGAQVRQAAQAATEARPGQVSPDPARPAQGRQRIRVVTYYDPSTGRYFQRRYPLEPNPGAAGAPQTQNQLAQSQKSNANQTGEPATGDADDVMLLPPPIDTQVGQASFDADSTSPTTASLIPGDTQKQFSVLEVQPETDAATADEKGASLPGGLPTLQPPAESTEAIPAIEPETDEDENLFELDLPALNGPGEGS